MRGREGRRADVASPKAIREGQRHTAKCEYFAGDEMEVKERAPKLFQETLTRVLFQGRTLRKYSKLQT